MTDKGKTCLVCGNSSWKPLYENTLLRCLQCDFITANMEVDEALMKEVYTEQYFNGEEYLNYLEDQEVQLQNFRNRLKTFQRVSGMQEPKQILEIGAAYGLFGKVLKEHFAQAEYVGFDVVPEAVDYAKQELHLDVRCEDYLAAKPDKKFDSVFMWDVIEHLPEPEKFIEKIAEETTENAWLSITTGDIDALLPKLQGKRWRMIHPPSHLHYFSKKSLTQLLENHGFEVKHVSYPSVARSIRLVFFGLFMLNKEPSDRVKKLHQRIPANWALGINTFDIMYVIAQKRNG